VQRVFKCKPPRLDLIFQRFNAPVYFVTFNTHIRTSLLATPEVHTAFVEYCRGAADFRIGVGRYVLMPDHIHLFACLGIGCTTRLSTWIKGLKRELDRILLSKGHEPINRPRQNYLRFGNRAFTIVFCEATRDMQPNGIMCSRIRYAHDSLLVLKTGHTRVRSCELIGLNKSIRAVGSAVLSGQCGQVAVGFVR
jgi:REP element-mobilizing transposase RayT